MNTQYQLFHRYAPEINPGSLEWIGLRPQHKMPMKAVDKVLAIKDLGLEGDHRVNKKPGSGRQVTIISTEFIEMIEKGLGKTIEPALLRRNLVISGMNLNALRYQKIRIGEAIFELNAICHPCKRMDHNLGPGGLVAMFGFGGFCAKVLKDGEIHCHDTVEVIT